MQGEKFHTITAEGVEATLDLRAGHVRRFAVEQDGRTLTPLHTAPWVDDAAITSDETLPGNLRFLSGDFFCAPFNSSDLDNGPPHGWPGNSAWSLLGAADHPDGGTIARYELQKPVMGARVIKEFTLRDGHPFLYERHIFMGGDGAVPVANHGMTRFTAGGTLSFSPKLYGMTPDSAPEPDPARGRSRLAYPTHFTDLTKVPMADGGVADLTTQPFAERHEDFVMLVEQPGSRFGWAAAARPDTRDVFLSLKNPADYPVTLLWFSNGGRDYAPWNSRHIGVQGIEEGRTYAGYGHRASIEPNPLTDAGIPTALVLKPNGEAEVRNVLGGLPLPQGSSRVVSVTTGPGTLTVEGDGGRSVTVPFDDEFLTRGR